MQLLNLTTEITNLQRDCIINWKKNDAISFSQQNFLKIVEENHAFNYQLWHAEDKARRDDLGPAFVYEAKRQIDAFNQQRNNRMEEMDTWLYQYLKPAQPDACTVHSETPGMIIDRLSILALKAYHMRLQTERKDIDQVHYDNCIKKLTVIEQQLKQLQQCLAQLLDECSKHTRTFRVYHQFKMYNDPSLNPELYQQ